MKRVIFYFDGFNFYNGLRDKSYESPQWINYYWLDLVKFSNQFITDENSELVKVKYFTAPAASMEKRLRQTALLNANRFVNNNLFHVINGVFKDKEIDCLATCGEMFTTKEEKKTDVAIGINMLLDCFEDNADRLVLVSADSDQVPTIKAIQSKFPNKNIQVYFPPKRRSSELLSLCRPIIYLDNQERIFKKTMLPDVIEENGTKRYSRPEKWQHP